MSSFVVDKHWGPITKAMREIYTAPTIEAAEASGAPHPGGYGPV